ncbi:hypothetical protein BC827DRAFT_1250789, partial [Russula dissimulans]
MLADPVGINREEPVRLAKLQVPVEHFNLSKLSKDRSLVHIEDQAAVEVVLDGTDFHNAAHLHFKADTFVPCEGCCKLSNVAALYIVEGANLFFTQQ